MRYGITVVNVNSFVGTSTDFPQLMDGTSVTYEGCYAKMQALIQHHIRILINRRDMVPPPRVPAPWDYIWIDPGLQCLIVLSNYLIEHNLDADALRKDVGLTSTQVSQMFGVHSQINLRSITAAMRHYGLHHTLAPTQ